MSLPGTHEQSLRFTKAENQRFLEELVDIVRSSPSATQEERLSLDDLLLLYRTMFTIDGVREIDRLWLPLQDTALPTGHMVWLAQGDYARGYNHIVDGHEGDFRKYGITNIAGAIDQVFVNGPLSTNANRDSEKPRVVALVLNDTSAGVMVAVGISSDGYIVTAFPYGPSKFFSFCQEWGIECPGSSELCTKYAKHLAVRDQAGLEPELVRELSYELPEHEISSAVWLIALGHEAVRFAGPHDDYLSVEDVKVFDCIPLALQNRIYSIEKEYTAWTQSRRAASHELILTLRIAYCAYELFKLTSHTVYFGISGKMVLVCGSSLRLIRRCAIDQLGAREVDQVNHHHGLDDVELSSSHNATSGSRPAMSNDDPISSS